MRDRVTIARHLTAIQRTLCSAPVRRAMRDRIVHRRNTVFDYGTGRGFDVRCLGASGIRVWGWDPYWRPRERKRPADVVNLGYVLNVIEDRHERHQVLRDAFRLARKAMVVSVRPSLEEASAMRGHRRWRDGWLVRRGREVYTFQKFYTPNELRLMVRQVLGRDAQLVQPGVAYVWKDEEARQRVGRGGYAGR